MLLRTKIDFEKVAEQIAAQYVAGNCETSINKFAQQVATENNLNPEQIRTMVRLANVSVFGRLFQAKTGEDRNVKFEPGDPEVVIDELYSYAKEAQCDPGMDSPYTREQDYYGDFYPREAAPVQEKVAEDNTVSFTGSPLEVADRIKKAIDQFMMGGKQAEQRWKTAMETAASVCKKNYGVKVAEAFPSFEKDILCADKRLGPEVSALRSMIFRDKVAGYAEDTIVQWQEHHVASLDKNAKEIFEHLKQAIDAREDYINCAACKAKAETSLAELK
jgi:hypothetical protein